MLKGRTAAIMGVAATLATALASPVATAAAGPSANERAKVLQALVDCRKLADSTERLACYDRSTAILDEAEKKGEVVVVDQAKVREVRRQSFGFTLPSLAVFNRATKDDSLDHVDVTIDGVAMDQNGRFIIITTEGATWRQTDGDLSLPPKHGQVMTIKPGMIGSYFCKVNHQSAVRCKREN